MTIHAHNALPLLLGGVLLATRLPAPAELAPVQFVVLVPDLAAQQSDQVYLATSIDGWRPDGRPVPRVAPGAYSTTFTLPVSTAVEFKITRTGTWESVEKSAGGGERANRRLVVAKADSEPVVICVVASWADRPAGPQRDTTCEDATSAATAQHTLTGNIRVHEQFASPELHNDRTIAVWLPPGYDENTDRRYPVLYLLDGNNVFDAATSFAGVEWAADETADALIRAGQIEPLVIVAVYNTAGRLAEYTPWKDARNGGGQGDEFLRFLANTLKPFIDQTYRTRPEPESTAIGGGSLGGLISLYAVYARDDVFTRALVFSPSLWWADWAVWRDLPTGRSGRTRKLSIFGATDELHGPAGFTTLIGRAPQALDDLLQTRGLRPGTDYAWVEVPAGGHHERDWAAQLGPALKFLFPARDRNAAATQPGN